MKKEKKKFDAERQLFFLEFFFESLLPLLLIVGLFGSFMYILYQALGIQIDILKLYLQE
ncbi:hypothetical protein [Paenibacillus campinasensis]|uniref:hypothetical protein n=1 Tax=Paenibacillus campinasensis TaxID=66347 RepID=UPI0015CA36CE|nr:hypothetical protein [Paenibacillus campinasensis]